MGHEGNTNRKPNDIQDHVKKPGFVTFGNTM